MDAEDSTPFGRGGQNSVPNVKVNSFTASKNSYFSGEIITLYWDVDNIRTLSLYNDSLLTSYLGDLTNKTLFNVSPVGDMTYYLDTETSVLEKKVYLYNEVSKNCNNWSPDASTVNNGVSFTQTRSCNVEYASNEPSSKTETLNEYKNETGTKINFGFTNNDTLLVRFENKNTSNNIYAQFISISEMKVFDSNDNLVEYEARENSDVLPRQSFWNDTIRNRTNINDGFESCSDEKNGKITTLDSFIGSQKYAFLNFYTNKNFNFKRIVFKFADSYYKVPSTITIYKAINGNINHLVEITKMSNVPSNTCYIELSI